MNAVSVGCGGYAARCLDYCLLSGGGFLDLEAYFVFDDDLDEDDDTPKDIYGYDDDDDLDDDARNGGLRDQG